MKLRSWSLLTACFMALALLGDVLGCTRGLHMDTYTANDGTMIDQMLGNEIGVVGAIHEHPGRDFRTVERRCYLDAQRSRDRDGNVTYHLLFSCTGEEGLAIYAGQSLTLIIDQHSVVLSGEGGVHRENALSKYVTESLSYRVSADILHKLADAHQVDVNVSSERGPLKGYFSAQNLANFKRFFEKYADRADRSAAQKQ